MDCTKTINFFSEAKRLCDSRTACSANEKNKERCPLFVFCKCTIKTRSVEEITKAIENLQKWSDKRSKKTYMQDFFETFPKAQMDTDGSPFACRKKIYGGVRPNDKACDRREACKNCWNEPMEE